MDDEIGRAEVVKCGRTQAYVEGRLEREADGLLVVRANMVNIFITPSA
jgi:acyl-coenzyme A thioesterase PaaI-like protein